MISPNPRITDREVHFVANKHCPEASFKCQADPVLVAKVLRARRFLCVGEQVYRHGEEG